MKNDYEIIGDTVVIKVLYKDKVLDCLVSINDLDILLPLNITWCANYDESINNYYIKYNKYVDGKFEHILLHRLIMNPPDGLEVDHISRNTLDNRRNNLRVVTRSINCINRKTKSNKKYKAPSGVSFHKPSNKWRVRMTINGKTKQYGVFDTVDEAIELRNILFSNREEGVNQCYSKQSS